MRENRLEQREGMEIRARANEKMGELAGNDSDSESLGLGEDWLFDRQNDEKNVYREQGTESSQEHPGLILYASPFTPRKQNPSVFNQCSAYFSHNHVTDNFPNEQRCQK